MTRSGRTSIQVHRQKQIRAIQPFAKGHFAYRFVKYGRYMPIPWFLHPLQQIIVFQLKHWLRGCKNTWDGASDHQRLPLHYILWVHYHNFPWTDSRKKGLADNLLGSAIPDIALVCPSVTVNQKGRGKSAPRCHWVGKFSAKLIEKRKTWFLFEPQFLFQFWASSFFLIYIQHILATSKYSTAPLPTHNGLRADIGIFSIFHNKKSTSPSKILNSLAINSFLNCVSIIVQLKFMYSLS